jgi:mannan endo-1,4-beta-mannosidase
LRIYSFSAVALYVAALASACSAQAVRLEAEDGSLRGPDMRAVLPSAAGSGLPLNFSGNGYVTGLQADADEVVFHPTIKQGGRYRLSLGYRASGHKGYEIEVNGLRLSGMVEATPDGRFGEQTVGTIELQTGANEVTVHKGWGFYDVDYVELSPAGPVARVARPVTAPSDPLVSTEARQLLGRLDDAYGKTSMVGVYKDRDAQYVFDRTGARPSIMGGDLLAYSPQEVAHGTHPERDAEVERLIARAGEGYVITLSWHWCSPSGLLETKQQPWFRGFYTEATRFDVAKALADPASEDYALLLRDIDAIAVQLRKLQDANVPVLWRPLHEAEGGWFWWGAKGPKPFVQLWQTLYDRLTKTDGIHNLLWVYTSGGDPAWYPGDAYVDVVGIDAYPKDLRDPEGQLWDTLRAQFGDRKVLTISEFGGVPDIPRMQRMGEFWSYAVSWSDQEGPKKNSVEELRRILASPGVVMLPASATTPVVDAKTETTKGGAQE